MNAPLATHAAAAASATDTSQAFGDSLSGAAPELIARLARQEQALLALETKVQALERRTPDDKVSIVVFSGDMDKILGAFVIANGALAMGMEVSMFFTFWGLAAVKRATELSGKAFTEKLFAMMTPSRLEETGISKLNFAGIGPAMMKKLMKEKNVASVTELRDIAREMDARMMGCTMSMDVMGVTSDELIEGVELGGVAAFMEDALKSRVTLFI